MTVQPEPVPGVAVGGTAVAVGGIEVGVGGTDVAVGGIDVAVGGCDVAVDGTAVAVGSGGEIIIGAGRVCFINVMPAIANTSPNTNAAIIQPILLWSNFTTIPSCKKAEK